MRGAGPRYLLNESRRLNESCLLIESCRLNERGAAARRAGSGAFVDAGAAADSGEAEDPGAHTRGRDVLAAGQFGRMELAVVGHRQRHPGVESLGYGRPARTAFIAGHDDAGEEIADADRIATEAH